jgi:hypothetical protein
MGDEIDDTIEKIRNPVIAKAAAVDAQQTMLAWVTLAVTGAISGLIGAFSFLLARRVRRSISGELGNWPAPSAGSPMATTTPPCRLAIAPTISANWRARR